jgi:hypothetical protein
MVRLTDGGGTVAAKPNEIVAFGVVAFVLVTASDFETMAPLAVAFAGVILLSTVLLVGPVAFDRINKLVTNATAKGSAP